MMGWMIAGGILALLLLLFWLPIQCKACFEEELFLRVRYAFVSIRVLPAKEKEEKPKPEKKAKKKKPQKEQNGKKEEKPPAEQEPGVREKLKEIIRYQGVSGFLSLLGDLAKIAAGTLKKLAAKIVVKQFDLLLVVGGEDAAETAVTYGKVCGVVYPAVGTILSACKCRRYGVTVCPDFDASESRVKFSITAQIRPMYLLGYAVAALFQLVKRLLQANRELNRAHARAHAQTSALAQLQAKRAAQAAGSSAPPEDSSGNSQNGAA